MVSKSGNAIFSEVLHEIKQDTNEIVNNTDELLVEKKIARLDREWALERKKYGVIDRTGEFAYIDETPQPSIGIYLILIVGWFFFVIIVANLNAGGGVSLLAMIIGTIVIAKFAYDLSRTDSDKERYKKAKNIYLDKRNELLKQVN